MSSTYITGMCAAARMDRHSGKVYYLLTEETYESNVYPRTPRWSAMHFGDYESCMRRILLGSTSCEGGMLKTPNGDISPSVFIKRWRELLAAPVALATEAVTLYYGESLYKVPQRHREAIIALASDCGLNLDDQAGCQTEHRIELDRPGAMAFVQVLAETRSTYEAHPWRLFNAGNVRSLPRPELGRQVPRAPASCLDTVAVYTLPARPGWEEDREHLLQTRHGTRCTGWAYSTVDAFIREHVVDAEARTPGCAETTIAAFRRMLKGASPAPLTTRIQVTRQAGDTHAYYASVADELHSQLGLGEGSPERFETTLQECVAAQALHHLRRMDKSQLCFTVPADSVAQAVGSNHGQQGDLLAQAA